MAAAAALALLAAAAAAAPAPSGVITYDQRQSGDYNVNVDVSNVELVAVLGDYGSYEYEDYEDPEDTEEQWLASSSTPSSTAPASNTPVLSSSSTPSSPSSPSAADAAATPSTAAPAVAPAAAPAAAKPTAASLADAPIEGATDAAPNAVTPSTHAPTPARRKCNVGYFRDRLGRCRRVPSTTLDFPFGFRVAPKFRREKLKEAASGAH